jgi:glucosamine--fructose-6-phosphate aminotransferase (isomerizing)
MTELSKYTPLLAEDSILGAEARTVVENLVRRQIERENWPLVDELIDPKRRRMVEVTTWEEMQTQPEAIQTTLEKERQAIAEIAGLLASKPLNRIYIVGCGDSWYSALGVRALFEELLGVPCEAMQALDFAYYYHKVVNEHSLVISVSSSGTTPRTANAMLVAQAMGAQSLAITNTAGSPMMEAADNKLLVHAKRQGWPTQASTAAMALMFQFAIDMAREKGVTKSELEEVERALYATPEQVAKVLKEENDRIVAIAKAEVDRHVYLYAGGGPAYSCAMFGAAKIKEETSDHAYALPQEEYHHFHSQKEGDPLWVIAPKGPSVPRARQTAEGGKRWGGQVYGVITEGGSPLKEHLDAAFELPAMDERLTPMVYTVPVQMFAYHVAMAKFRAADAKHG